jgi:hypothetical protein
MNNAVLVFVSRKVLRGVLKGGDENFPFSRPHENELLAGVWLDFFEFLHKLECAEILDFSLNISKIFLFETLFGYIFKNEIKRVKIDILRTIRKV